MGRTHTVTVVEKEILPQMDSLYRFCLYLTRDRTEAEELTQETMLKAVNAIDSYQPGTNARAWLFRIATNTHLNRVRRRTPEVELNEAILPAATSQDEAAAFLSGNGTPEECFVSGMSRAKVRDAIEKLPEEFRTVVVLADLEELSYREIAEVVGCPIGTVMSRLHRGRRMLRGLLLSWAREIGLVLPAAPAGEFEGGQAACSEVETEGVTFLSAYRKRADAAGDTEGSGEV